MQITPLPKGKLWFDYANYKEQPRYQTLSDEEKAIVEQFKREGCYLCRNAVGEEVVEALNEALDDWMVDNISSLVANKRPDDTYPRLIGLHEELPVIGTLFSHETVRRLQSLLFGGGDALRTTITFVQGSQQPLHRDIPIFNVAPDALYFRMWIALEDATVENGTLTGVKGGHRVAVERHEMPHRFYTRFEDVPEQDPDLWRSHQEALKQAYQKAGLKEEPIELAKGDLLIWHPLFPHGGSKIENKKLSRRSVVLHVTLK